MLKHYISKFTIDILPSIIATIVGAYIVNHYIIPKNGADKPAAAVASTPAESKSTPSKPDAKAAARPAETSSDVANVPDPAPAKTKGTDKPVVEKASIDKANTDTASTPEPRRHQPTVREKAVAKVTPAPVTPAAVAPALATVGTAPAADTSADERRDANDLARAAIERLNRSEPRAQEAARTPEAPRIQETPRVQEVMRTVPAPSMQQLPPPIVVATPHPDIFNQPQSSYPQAERSEARRPRPPGEIPVPLPMDLQADATGTVRERTSVAEDVLSAAKSVFHSVIPKQFDR